MIGVLWQCSLWLKPRLANMLITSCNNLIAVVLSFRELNKSWTWKFFCSVLASSLPYFFCCPQLFSSERSWNSMLMSLLQIHEPSSQSLQQLDWFFDHLTIRILVHLYHVQVPELEEILIICLPFWLVLLHGILKSLY